MPILTPESPGRPSRTCARRGAWQWIRAHLVRSFRHSVGFEHGRAKDGFHPLRHLRRQRRAARPYETQRFGARRPLVALPDPGKQKLVHSGYRGVPSGAIVPHRPPKRERIEARRNDHRTAGVESRQRRGHQSMHVKQRHHGERNIGRTKVIGGGDVLHRSRQVAMLQRHALGPAGATARVQDQRDVIRSRRGSLR